MHQFLRAVGFSDIATKKQIKNLMNDVIVKPNGKDFMETDRNSVLVEYSKDYSSSAGITLRGEFDEEENLTLDYFYPYVKASKVSTTEDVNIERHAAQESFAGVLEDYRVGVTIIFYAVNGIEIMKRYLSNELGTVNTSVSFSGLSLYGTVMLPIIKNDNDRQKSLQANKDRSQRMVAAKQGDEEAIEKLTLEDIDTYSAISKRILKDDIYSLVDSYFMPYGVECDQYSVLGEIEECSEEINSMTQEKIHVLSLNCNGLPITVCINDKDLLGEPQVGRRFKGNIWLQGMIHL